MTGGGGSGTALALRPDGHRRLTLCWGFGVTAEACAGVFALVAIGKQTPRRRERRKDTLSDKEAN